ncbi:hypothetical protein TanjilG_08450 [Lupinus angustifolius]|uniref:PPPDE domain-containing protein n=1 Tax=Lupinus angustifolius TaxID=3871 RepID=A0A1J7I422_LUPAN|nr:PREDICTED: desumoylating isopeptidase 1-like [Lupinus angustifolius]XP_019450131.1 PREDICTED: desumoylating isopeptidase 1-like [Lupinus angustifolius]OIW07563.1 hypothetical protein TanjilG_08450 [Lupinus angustifolius]
MAEEGHRVTLNVYDLSQGLARQLSTSFLGKAIEGIWHTGIVVYGNEYYFGGGIQHCPAGTTQYGVPLKVVELGVTHVPKDVFEMYLQEISPWYTAEAYSLLTHNCNNFSNEVAQFLIGATIPEYILNLPNEVMSSPMGALVLPMIQNLEATMRSGGVPKVPQFSPSTAAPSHTAPATTAKASGSTNSSTNSDNSKTRAEPQKPSPNVVAGDPLGDARGKVQDEIIKEFTAIMATGTMRASEAAALATKRVMQKYGHAAVSQS